MFGLRGFPCYIFPISGGGGGGSDNKNYRTFEKIRPPRRCPNKSNAGRDIRVSSVVLAFEYVSSAICCPKFGVCRRPCPRPAQYVVFALLPVFAVILSSGNANLAASRTRGPTCHYLIIIIFVSCWAPATYTYIFIINIPLNCIWGTNCIVYLRIPFPWHWAEICMQVIGVTSYENPNSVQIVLNKPYIINMSYSVSAF